MEVMMDSQFRFSDILVYLQTYILFFILSFMFLPFATLIDPDQKQAMSDQIERIKSQQEFLQRIQSQLELRQQHYKFLEKIKEYPTKKKINAFLKTLDDAAEKGYDTQDRLHSLSQQRQAAMNTPQTSLVFTQHGFFVGMAEPNPVNGNWHISGLPEGDYYIVEQNQGRWQDSALSSVKLNKNAEGMNSNFSTISKTSDYSDNNSPLINDASISGTVTGNDGLPLTFAFIFIFDLADTSIAGFNVSAIGDGSFSIPDLAAGSYIAYADSYFDLAIQMNGATLATSPHGGEYYDSVTSPDQATAIVLAESEARVGVDFSLESGGAISGTVTDETGTPLDSLLLVTAKIDFGDPNAFFTENIDFSMTSTDVQGNYTLSGLSPGDYILGTVSIFNPNFAALAEGAPGKHFGLVLDEFYDGAQGLFGLENITLVTVTNPDTTKDINIDLDLAGAISGDFIEFAGGAPVEGQGIVIAFHQETGLPIFAVDVDPSPASYEIRPLPQGDYKILGLVESDSVEYIPQFYNLKDFENADLVTVTPPNITANINFAMIRPGEISGVVNIPTSSIQSTQQDESEMFVVAYSASTGEVAGGADVDPITSEYNIYGLFPGNYLVEAIPDQPGLAATYFGGGIAFNDANSTQVTVPADGIATADIDLMTGEGVISGTITDQNGNPLSAILVIAYDETGHAVAFGVSGMDITTQEIDPTSGDYDIPGLAAGNYYLRTFTLFQFFLLLGEMEGGTDPFALLSGLALGQNQPNGLLSSQLYTDLWYMNQLVETGGPGSLFDLFFTSFLGEAGFQLFLPFFDQVPNGATMVTVTSPGQQTGIDFVLPAYNFIQTDVEEQPVIATIPEDFQLHQNYPNPFNPSTVITFSVPQATDLQLNVYNVLGQSVKTLFDGHKEAGVYTIQWNGLDRRGAQVTAGNYILRLEAGSQVLTRKMLLLK